MGKAVDDVFLPPGAGEDYGVGAGDEEYAEAGGVPGVRGGPGIQLIIKYVYGRANPRPLCGIGTPAW